MPMNFKEFLLKRELSLEDSTTPSKPHTNPLGLALLSGGGPDTSDTQITLAASLRSPKR